MWRVIQPARDSMKKEERKGQTEEGELKGKHNKAAQQLMLKRNAKQGSCLWDFFPDWHLQQLQ